MDAREKLLKATLKYVTRSGIHGMAMGPLSQRSGIAVGNFYHHFGSKEGLIDNLYIYCRQQMGEALREAHLPKHNYRKQFQVFGEALYAHLLKNKAACVFVGEAELGKAVSRDALHQGELAMAPIAEFLYLGIEHKKIRPMDNELALRLFYESIVAAVMKSSVSISADSNESRDAVIDFAWSGFKLKKGEK